ncbi:LysR family transcriptional regulator [Sphingomonas mali]|jgi:DNA-binding transcriptional LysR family regulator|uniref:LysR family transcriptional regulator n=1 Tax=Sphingomonas mali TaxID=40682 RepID=UPI0008295E49|nr:LysR family transcriptional regulator [Sphingomonas mali]
MQRIVPGDLNGFLAIARAKSFRRAAVELGVTPSALSHNLRALEERLDLRLVNRTTRSISLTEVGQKLFDRIEPAFRDIDDAIEELSAWGGKPIGTLRLNTALASARLELMPLLADFLAANPSVEVEIIAQTALIDTVAQGYDAGVRFGERIAADMIAVPIGRRRRFAVVGSPAYFERWPKPAHPRDLIGLPCVRYRFERGDDYHWEFERAGEELEIAVDGPFTTNEHELMLSAALDGIGLAFVFEEMVVDLVAAGRLERVLGDWCPYWPGLYLYYPSRRQMPSPLRAFIDFARSRAG